MRYLQQKGFAVLEVIIVLIIVAAFAGTGYWVYKQRTSDNKQPTSTSLQDTTDEDAVSSTTVPTVKDTADLQAAEAALDSTTLEQNNEELDSQLSGF